MSTIALEEFKWDLEEHADKARRSAFSSSVIKSGSFYKSLKLVPIIYHPFYVHILRHVFSTFNKLVALV